MMVLGGSEGSSVSIRQTIRAFIEDVEEPSADLVRYKEGWRFGAVGCRFVSSPQPWKKQSGARKALAKDLIS